MHSEIKTDVRHGKMGHIGLYSKDVAATAAFYQKHLGMRLVGGSSADYEIGETAFLASSDGDDSHVIALFAKPGFEHIAFKLDSLADLKASYSHYVESGIPIKMVFDHGSSFAFYIEDPGENLIEIYWNTGLDYRQPYIHPLDLTLPESELQTLMSFGARPI